MSLLASSTARRNRSIASESTSRSCAGAPFAGAFASATTTCGYRIGTFKLWWNASPEFRPLRRQSGFRAAHDNFLQYWSECTNLVLLWEVISVFIEPVAQLEWMVKWVSLCSSPWRACVFFLLKWFSFELTSGSTLYRYRDQGCKPDSLANVSCWVLYDRDVHSGNIV